MVKNALLSVGLLVVLSVAMLVIPTDAAKERFEIKEGQYYTLIWCRNAPSCVETVLVVTVDGARFKDASGWWNNTNALVSSFSHGAQLPTQPVHSEPAPPGVIARR